MDSSCYIINFYLGDRRRTIHQFHKDRLVFVKDQIKFLEKYSHSLNLIVFNFNMREEDYHYVSNIFDLVPKFIQGAKVVVNFRTNKGYSYGAWSDVYKKYQNQYGYYIFQEDDYFFIQNDWDKYLIDKFNSFGDCGYLCGRVSEPQHWNHYRKHAAHAIGISSNEALRKVWDLKGHLPHDNNKEYESAEKSQLLFSFAFIEVGLNVCDIRDDYRVPFAHTTPPNKKGRANSADIHKFFWWNKNVLLAPAFYLYNPYYSWWHCFDGELEREFIPLTSEEALECYKGEIWYDDFKKKLDATNN